VLLAPSLAPAQDLSVGPSKSTHTVAFAQYIASIQEPNPFTELGPVAVQIDAALPALYKQCRILAIRAWGETERMEYRVLQIEGDPIVAQEVIGPYLKGRDQIDVLPLSSIAVTPANYKFRYMGEVGSGPASAYVYQITPKKKRDGLIQGRLWIDSVTGTPVLKTGRFVKMPPNLTGLTGRIEVVQDTHLQNGYPRGRITHVTIETRQVGRGELTITELPLASTGGDGPDARPQP